MEESVEKGDEERVTVAGMVSLSNEVATQAEGLVS